MIRLTKIFTFETAHALFGYDGKCKNIHGHSYQLYVTIKGKPLQEPNHPKNGMVMDFGNLKAIVKEQIVDILDHSILLQSGTPHEELGLHLKKEGHQVIFTAYTPTCENILMDFASILNNHLPKEVTLESLKLHETGNSYCEWHRADQ